MKKVLVVLSLLASVNVWAQLRNDLGLIPGDDLSGDDQISELVQVGEIGYGGTGCPAATALVDLHGDSLLVLLDKMVLKASSSASFARAACNIRLPITVAEGYEVVVSGIQSQGDFRTRSSDTLTLDQSINFVGQEVQTSKLKLKGTSRLLTQAEHQVVSKCGGSSMLAVSVVGLLRQTKSNLNSYLRVRSAELKLEVRPCSVN